MLVILADRNICVDNMTFSIISYPYGNQLIQSEVD